MKKTKEPYLLRAIHEWCTDCGFTPYISVYVNNLVKVPMQFVENNSIVLDVSYEATDSLLINDEEVIFYARFSGKEEHIIIPISNVMAIFSAETKDGIVLRNEIPDNIIKEKEKKDEKKRPTLKIIK